LWALCTRVEPGEDIQIVAPGGRGQVFQPGQRVRITKKGQQWVASAIKFAGGLAIDATAPYDVKWAFERPAHHRVDLKKQWPYHKFLSESGI
jgi:hypothetical protein